MAGPQHPSAHAWFQSAPCRHFPRIVTHVGAITWCCICLTHHLPVSGTSDYQAAWIMDNEYGDSEGSEEGEETANNQSSNAGGGSSAPLKGSKPGKAGAGGGGGSSSRKSDAGSMMGDDDLPDLELAEDDDGAGVTHVSGIVLRDLPQRTPEHWSHPPGGIPCMHMYVVVCRSSDARIRRLQSKVPAIGVR